MLSKTFMATMLTAALSSGYAFATEGEDSSTRDPLAFGEAVDSANAVILRVPVNEKGEENTDQAQLRFLDDSTNVGAETDAATLWEDANPVKEGADFLGTEGPEVDPRTDSSTWGWYYWYYRGWSYPYYYYSYYPTFYYNYYWYYYRPYYYWNYPSYRYYYYNRWWW